MDLRDIAKPTGSWVRGDEEDSCLAAARGLCGEVAENGAVGGAVRDAGRSDAAVTHALEAVPAEDSRVRCVASFRVFHVLLVTDEHLDRAAGCCDL